MKDRRIDEQRGLDMWLKKIRGDRKEPPTEPKEEVKEEEQEAEQEVKEPDEAAEPRGKPAKTEQELVEEVRVEEIELPKTQEVKAKGFLRGREGPFTITELTKRAGLSLKIAKTVLKMLISTGEVDTRTFGKTAVYWRTGHFKAGSEVPQLAEGVTESTQEEIQRLKETIVRLEQERAVQARHYETIRDQLKELETKERKHPEGQLTSFQERISALEEEKEALMRQIERVRAQLVEFQTRFAGKDTEWKAVAERMAEEMAARAGTSTEDVLRFFEAPGYP